MYVKTEMKKLSKKLTGAEEVVQMMEGLPGMHKVSVQSPVLSITETDSHVHKLSSLEVEAQGSEVPCHSSSAHSE